MFEFRALSDHFVQSKKYDATVCSDPLCVEADGLSFLCCLISTVLNFENSKILKPLGHQRSSLDGLITPTSSLSPTKL